MSERRRFSPPVICLLGVSLLAMGVLIARDAYSFPESKTAPVKWEYNTATVDTTALQAKLEELGNDGWEVFSIERSRQFIEQDAANKTRLVADQFQVTSRRQ